METIGIIFIILTILGFTVPFVGIILFIRYIIKKSKADQPVHVLKKEQNEMVVKVRSKQNNLVDWKPEYLEKMSNLVDYNYRKGFTRRFNGYIKTLEGEKLIAFRRLDRGNFKTTSQIIALTKDFEITFSQKQDDVSIHFNSQYLGKLVNRDTILNDKNEPIGKLKGRDNDERHYIIEFKNEPLAYVIKNSDRRLFLRNPFYDFNPTNILEVEPWEDNEVSITKILKLYRELNDVEYNWILALVVYVVIYYGIDFTQ